MFTIYDNNYMEEITQEELEELQEQYDIVYSDKENCYINRDTSDYGWFDDSYVTQQYIGDNDLQYCEDIEEYSDEYVFLEDTCKYVTHDYAVYNCYRCDDCGEWYEYDNGREIGGTWYCSNCADYHQQYIYTYHGYDGGYAPRKLGNEAGLYLGFELEVDETDDNEELAESVLDEDTNEVLHCEYDSSVEFEFISQPCTLAYHKKQDYESWFFDNLVGHCTSHNAGTCGLHVHVNKSFFNDESYGRLKTILFFFKQELFKFSRRQRWDYSYADFEEDIPKKDVTISKAKRIKKGGHDTWFNEDSGSTYEFRFFRGTLKYSTFMASLELVDNICKMAVSDKKTIFWDELLDGEYCREYSKSRGISCDIPLNFEELENKEVERVRSILDYVNKYVFLRDEYVLIGSINKNSYLIFDYLDSRISSHFAFYTDFNIDGIDNVEEFLYDRDFTVLCDRVKFESLLKKGGVL